MRLQATPAPTADFDSLVSIINAAYDHEKMVTERIDALASLALDRRDFNTLNMRQHGAAALQRDLPSATRFGLSISPTAARPSPATPPPTAGWAATSCAGCTPPATLSSRPPTPRPEHWQPLKLLLAA